MQAESLVGKELSGHGKASGEDGETDIRMMMVSGWLGIEVSAHGYTTDLENIQDNHAERNQLRRDSLEASKSLGDGVC